MDIRVWYGHSQRFGHLGVPQRWVNILGSVAGAQAPVRLTYRLNRGRDHPLSTGPDGLRLRGDGDFNAEILCEDLRPGANQVLLSATDGAGCTVTETVDVHYVPDTRWSLPYHANLRLGHPLPDAVQVVEGQWLKTPLGIRPKHPSYDRLVAVGDRTWTDYRVRVTATVHGFVDGECGVLQGGFGLLMRWTGHYADGNQPCGEWRPSGAIGWYRARWEDQPAPHRNLNISDGVVKDEALVETRPLTLDPNRPHIFECSVRSQPGGTSLYGYRVWPAGSSDELLCDLSTEGRPGESPSGSLLLIALYADVTLHEIEAELP